MSSVQIVQSLGKLFTCIVKVRELEKELATQRNMAALQNMEGCSASRQTRQIWCTGCGFVSSFLAFDQGFQLIAEAYEVLSKPSTRSEYDEIHQGLGQKASAWRSSKPVFSRCWSSLVCWEVRRWNCLLQKFTAKASNVGSAARRGGFHRMIPLWKKGTRCTYPVHLVSGRHPPL